MDQFERLAAFLADELDADERAALERELAHDPDLRHDLDAMRRADEALAVLPSPSPNPGFEARIDAAVDAELRDLLGDTASSTTAEIASPGHATVLGSGDRFVARRQERSTRPVRMLVGVAAGVAVLAVGGVAITQFGPLGGRDTEDSMAMDAQVESDAADDSAALSVAPARAPVLVDEDRDIDDAALDALLAAPELEAVRGDALDADSGRELAEAFQTTLGAGTGSADGSGASTDEGEAADAPEAEEAPAEESAPSDEAAESDMSSDADAMRPELFSRDGRRLPAEATDDVARCLGVLLNSDRTAIPVYAELATYQGIEVIVFGLVTLDPATNAFSRTEVWALDRTDCQVLRFSQS